MSMKLALAVTTLLALTISVDTGWAASATGAQPGATTIPAAKYSSTIGTQNGRSVLVIGTSSVRHGAPKFDILGVPGRASKVSCTNHEDRPDFYDCYDCGNQTIDDSTPYKGACTYLGFCTSGYNGNSSYCSF